MADEDVATKAPESDAKEPSMMSSEDTPAQTGASMGVRYLLVAETPLTCSNQEHCVTDRPSRMFDCALTHS